MVALTQETQLAWLSQVSGPVVGVSWVAKVGGMITLEGCCCSERREADGGPEQSAGDARRVSSLQACGCIFLRGSVQASLVNPVSVMALPAMAVIE